MKREEALKQLEIMNAWAAGKTIQFRLKVSPWAEKPEFKDYYGGVNDESPAVFNTESYEWRIKPEPRIVYIPEYPTGELLLRASGQDHLNLAEKGYKLVKFIEVIE